MTSIERTHFIGDGDCNDDSAVAADSTARFGEVFVSVDFDFDCAGAVT